ncbi:GDSL-like Lipase/Acylhydrolase [Aerococcus viridans]|nr:GDSL-like Lipase/Acylhydrolase [Aerococcus viridans]
MKGILSDNSDYEASEIIPVVAGEKLTISNVPLVEVRHAFYSAANNFIKGAVSVPMPLTATQDGYFRFSYRIGGKPMIEKGEIATTYEPYKEILKGVTIEGTDTGSGNNDFKVNFTLSPKIYGVVGQELNIYFKNIIDQKDTSLDFDVSSSFGKQMTDRLTGVPEQATTTTIGISAYKDHEQVGAGSTSLVTTNIATKDVKVLYFGDSTVNAGGVTKRLLDLYSAESSSLTLLGTRGLDSTNRYEGRGGWSGVTYRTPTEIYGAGNPFYNPAKSDFDFNYYMTQQGYSGLDHFIIQLGINDTFGMTSDETLQTKIDTILSDFDYIINDVKSYDSNIKVGMTVTIPPNASQDAFGTVYGTGQTQWRYKRNNALWVPRLIDHYKDKESQGIYLVPMQHNIDTVNNIADGVHPTQTGYDQMGDSVYAYLKNIG